MMTALDRNINFSVRSGTGEDLAKVDDSNSSKSSRQKLV